MFHAVLLIGLVLQLTCAEECTPVSSGGPDTCKTCGVTIGGVSYCSQCNDAGGTISAPTDGKCTTDNAVCNAKAEGKCTTCTESSFMYRGGCYRTADGPGNVMCTQATNGVCTRAKDGYFVPPGADASHQSILPCGDVEEITVKDGKRYRGVPHCTRCNAPEATQNANAVPALCTACEDGYLNFKDGCVACHKSCRTCRGTNTKDGCTSCAAGTHFLAADGRGVGICVKCDNTEGANGYRGVAGCAKCFKPRSFGPAICTECAAGLYLREDVGVSECVPASGCGDGYFPATVSGVRRCVSCGETKNGGIEDCEICSLRVPAPGEGVMITCSTCERRRKVSPLKDACLDSCPSGTYDDQDVCTPCHSSCASCTDSTSVACTTCYPGFVLGAAAGASIGTCIQECTGKYGENCADGQCTAVVGGSKYCSKCKTGFAPVDGVCVSTASRAVPGCTPRDGACDACTGTYFLQSGGCYQSTKYPGNTLCSSAVSGKCTQCANGQTIDNDSGSCPACPAGCSKCTGNASSQQCSECFPGYYKSGPKCIKCDADDSQITGVSGCLSCAPPFNSQGSVTCYVNKDGTNGEGTSGSINRSGLSTSVIAGVSTVAVIVVGGLVGFLCWWFIYKGRA